MSANPGIEGEFESLLWRTKTGLAVNQNFETAKLYLSNYIFYLKKIKCKNLQTFHICLKDRNYMSKSELGRDNLMHLYSTNINAPLVLVLLSDVQVLALHQ